MENLTHAHMPILVPWLFFFILFPISTSTFARNLDRSPSPTQRTELTLTFSMSDVLGNHQNSQSFSEPAIGRGLQHPSPKTFSPFSTAGAIPASNPSTSRTDASSGWWNFLISPQALEPGLLTKIDEEITGNVVLGPQLQGKMQGISVTSSENNSRHIVALKAAFTGSDSIGGLRFFGLHQPSLPESHIAVVGGTGKYLGANGYAIIKATSVDDDGERENMKKLLSFTVYLQLTGM